MVFFVFTDFPRKLENIQNSRQDMPGIAVKWLQSFWSLSGSTLSLAPLLSRSRKNTNGFWHSSVLSFETFVPNSCLKLRMDQLERIPEENTRLSFLLCNMLHQNTLCSWRSSSVGWQLLRVPISSWQLILPKPSMLGVKSSTRPRIPIPMIIKVR